MTRSDEKRENPFVKGSVYHIRSIGTQETPTDTRGEFLGFTPFGMGGEGMMMRLADDHGDEAGRVRVIPIHMLMHVDVLEQKEEDDDKDEESHPVSYS